MAVSTAYSSSMGKSVDHPEGRRKKIHPSLEGSVEERIPLSVRKKKPSAEIRKKLTSPLPIGSKKTATDFPTQGER